MDSSNVENKNNEEDEILIKKAKQNSEDFTLLYDKYLTPIYRYFLSRVSHGEVAEDLTSQTFLQAFKAFTGYEPQSKSFAPWLYTIAHNILVNNYRKPASLPLEEAEALTDQTDLNTSLETTLQREKMQELLQSLPSRDQEVVMLRSADDLSFAQIAEVLQISETAARTAHHRAVKKLASLYQEKNAYAAT